MFYIYKIENLCNGKSYIGCSNNAEKRFKQHVNLLNKNKHKNPKLQNAWNCKRVSKRALYGCRFRY